MGFVLPFRVLCLSPVKINETIRKDGLRIITVAVPNKRKVYVELVARVGSAYDPSNKLGLFHFFEHLAFKGTKRRSAEDIQSYTNRNILGTNATTGELGTTYYGISVYTKLKETCDLFCDIYCNSIFPTKELRKEVRPVLLEIARNKDNDFAVADEALRKQLWKNNPLRLPAGGTTKGVQSVTRADLLREKKKWHIPSATVAVAIGKVNHKSFVREINKGIPLKFKRVMLNTWSDEYSELPRKQRVVIKKPGRKKALIMLGFKLPLAMPERTKVCFYNILMQLLASGDGSRLWKEVREKRGLAYTCGGYVSSSVGLAKYVVVYAETSPKHIAKVEKLMCRSLLNPLTSQSDFKETKERKLDQLTVGFDDAGFNEYEDQIWQKIVEGKPVRSIVRHYSDAHRILTSLSLRDVEAIRKEFFRPERFAIVVVKPS